MAAIFKRTYKVTLPNGKTVTRKCAHFTIKYRDPNGKPVVITPTDKMGQKITDKGVAQAYWNNLRKEWANETVGLSSPFKSQLAKAYTDHLSDYIGDMRACGRDPKHVYITEHRLATLGKECKWSTLADINAPSFTRWRNERQKTGHPKGIGNLLKEGASAATLNQFLNAARAFTNWCASNGRMPGVAVGNRLISPVLAGITKADGPEVRKRRALSDDEVVRLLDKTPKERKMFTRLGMALGLRRDELNQLLWGDVRLNAIRPYVQLRSEATKARRADRLDIPATLAEDLRIERPATARDSDRVFSSPPTIDDWKKDLKAAGIAYKDDLGRQADFHGGTRKTLCSRMHRLNVPLATAMRRMRHTDSKLTLVDYVDDDQIGLDAGILPELLPEPSKVVSVDAAGA